MAIWKLLDIVIFQKETVTAKVNMKAYTYVLKTINKTKKTKTENR